MRSKLRLIGPFFFVPALIAVVVLGLDFLLFRGLEFGAVSVPKGSKVDLAPLDQGWRAGLSRDYHRRAQGTKILPKAWFLALREPSVDPIFPGSKLASREYLSRFGFAYEPKAGPDDLPIGFAIDVWDRDVDYVDPPITTRTEVVGLTCAACHTGRIEFGLKGGQTRGFLVEGGSAMINLGAFKEAVGQALFWTLKYRLNQFTAEAHELGDRRPAAEIERDLRRYIDTGIAGKNYNKEHQIDALDAGFGRTDALGLIGNRVFGPLNDENQSVTDAPVNFPHIWDTAWFDWVQYNASIRLPLARNIGEALGVGAAVKLELTEGQGYKTTVKVDNLAWMEDVLGGNEPFPPRAAGPASDGLLPPRWEDMSRAVAAAGGLADEAEDRALTINPGRRDAGAALYREHCVRCHLPPREALRAEWERPESHYWELDSRSGKKFLRLKVVDLNEVGTDPNQAVNFYRRFAVVPNPRASEPEFARESRTPAREAVGYPRSGTTETISAAEGLYRVTSSLRKKYFDEYFHDEARTLFDADQQETRRQLDRSRTLPIAPRAPEIFLRREDDILNGLAMDDVIRANLGYKARPLDGIWATPPYLHNGSVPNLDQLLKPAADRTSKFPLGTARFDPVNVGYHTEDFHGAFAMDTSLSGNANVGHEFRNLTLEEFKFAQVDPSHPAPPGDSPSMAERTARIFGTGFDKLDDKAREEAFRARTSTVLAEARSGRREVVRNPMFLGVRGVLGPRLGDAERLALIEYMKSL